MPRPPRARVNDREGEVRDCQDSRGRDGRRVALQSCSSNINIVAFIALTRLSRNRSWIKAATWVLAGLVHDVQARRWKGESRRGKQIIVMIYQLSAMTSVLGECTDKVVSYSKRSWLFLRPPISTFAPRAPVGPSVSVPARD